MKEQMDIMGEECGATGGTKGIEGEEAGEPIVADLANILQVHIVQQEAREAKFDREVACKTRG